MPCSTLQFRSARPGAWLLALLWLLTAAGCVSTRPVEPPPGTPEQLTVEALLKQAEKLSSPQREEYLILAAEQRLQQQQIAEADQLSGPLDIGLLPLDGRRRLALLRAEIALDSNQIDAASNWFNLPSAQFEQLNDASTLARLSLLRARWFEAKDQPLLAARERILADPLLAETARGDNHRQIWTLLGRVNPDRLRATARALPDNDLRGWLELAALDRQFTEANPQRLAALADWRSRWPRHPAAIEPPAGIADTLRPLEAAQQQGHARVLLLLPLSGPLAAAGEVVRDGFMARYYQQLAAQQPLPELVLIDSAATPQASWLPQAQALKVDAIIGPLPKEMVEALNQQPLDIPVLALNYLPEGVTPQPNLHQFGLANEVSAQLTARQASSAGQRRAALLFADSPWSRRLERAFRTEWHKLGGEVVASASFNEATADHAQAVRQLLQVTAPAAPTVAGSATAPVDGTAATASRRQDIDCIVLIAAPEQGRLIAPLFRLYFAGDLPLYGVTTLYAGRSNPRQDSALDGIIFNDIPWLVETAFTERAEIAALWPAAYPDHARLYALGRDALDLLPALEQLKAPGAELHGATGLLRLDADRRIQREQVPTRFENGVVVRLPAAGSGPAR
ncbi:MAG: penicillin-binding protein activator [Pseudomonadales bacterium]|nr:penicillin-binding protein activator [Pseudomonadales bacterium]